MILKPKTTILLSEIGISALMIASCYIFLVDYISLREDNEIAMEYIENFRTDHGSMKIELQNKIKIVEHSSTKLKNSKLLYDGRISRIKELEERIKSLEKTALSNDGT